jgi:hypothetical protein
VKNQVLELVEFDMELQEKSRLKIDGEHIDEGDITAIKEKSEAIELLVNNVHSIPVRILFLHLLKT